MRRRRSPFTLALPASALGLILLVVGLPSCFPALKRPTDPIWVCGTLRVDGGRAKLVRWDISAPNKHWINASASVELILRPCKSERLQMAAGGQP